MGIINEEEMLNEFYNRYFIKYKNIIDIIENNKGCNGISEISQKEIAIKLRINTSAVSKCIRRLERLERSDKCIEKLKPGIYKVNHTDLRKYGPYNKFLKYCSAIVRYDGYLNLKWGERANLIDISIEEVIMVNAYWVEFTKGFKRED